MLSPFGEEWNEHAVFAARTRSEVDGFLARLGRNLAIPTRIATVTHDAFMAWEDYGVLPDEDIVA